MADTLSTIGSIATHLATVFQGLPAVVSGNLLPIVDMARQHVANYTGVNIGSNSIADRFQPAILFLAKADIVDLLNAQPGGESISLADLSISESGDAASAEQYRALAEINLRALGRDIKFGQAL